MTHDWWSAPARSVDASRGERARQRQRELTKPPGSLGRLEDIAVRLATMQTGARLTLERVHIVVFAGDHGVCAEGVSAYPQAVTAQMLRNFANGGAAINVLARALDATLEVVDVGTAGESAAPPGVRAQRVAAGTGNIRRACAMNDAQLRAALTCGRALAEQAATAGTDLLVGGEMGIGNTTVASALACAALNLRAEQIVGPGTGLDAAGVRHKIGVVDAALARHAGDFGPKAGAPLTALRSLGGFEIAALVGVFVRAAQLGMPVLVDGFIAGVAALYAARLTNGGEAWFFYAHRSTEPGHAAVLRALEAEPLLDLGLRLGEGSGAAVAVPLLRLACALHNEMATFTAAGVSEAQVRHEHE